jgi:hypothetical protein
MPELMIWYLKFEAPTQNQTQVGSGNQIWRKLSGPVLKRLPDMVSSKIKSLSLARNILRVDIEALGWQWKTVALGIWGFAITLSWKFP